MHELMEHETSEDQEASGIIQRKALGAAQVEGVVLVSKVALALHISCFQTKERQDLHQSCRSAICYVSVSAKTQEYR